MNNLTNMYIRSLKFLNCKNLPRYTILSLINVNTRENPVHLSSLSASISGPILEFKGSVQHVQK